MNTLPWHRIISTAEKWRTVSTADRCRCTEHSNLYFLATYLVSDTSKGARRFYDWTFQLQLNLQLMFKLSPNTLGSTVVKNQTQTAEARCLSQLHEIHSTGSRYFPSLWTSSHTMLPATAFTSCCAHLDPRPFPTAPHDANPSIS
jgi:hypothetical protein